MRCIIVALGARYKVIVDYKLEFGHPLSDPQGSLVWPTSSLPMVAGSGTGRPVKHLTRTGSAPISAKASKVIERWAGESALRCIRFAIEEDGHEKCRQT